ncbi:hypothetical protein DRO91_09170 [Candidatus Heimdallarchaeota archaeon]|nr:MAG: hypothetical protein DRO91_09170 [Candidatus Heimdallarchaeota archaeon]
MDPKCLASRLKQDRAILEDVRNGKVEFEYGTGGQVFIKTPSTFDYFMCTECGLFANPKIIKELGFRKFPHGKEECKQSASRQPEEVLDILREIRILLSNLYEEIQTPSLEDLEKEADTELKKHLVNLLKEYFDCKDEKRKRGLLTYINERFIELEDDEFKEKFRRLIK